MATYLGLEVDKVVAQSERQCHLMYLHPFLEMISGGSWEYPRNSERAMGKTWN